MKKILVLGAGLVGKAMAIDLATSFDVTAADVNEEALAALQAHNIKTLKLDFTNHAKLTEAIQAVDLVIGAVPGFMGFNVVKTVITCGKPMVDISFFPEDPFLLDDLAKKHNVTIVVDCG